MALSEELNFTLAAHQLHISQPTLTKQIAELEHRLGFSLSLSLSLSLIAIIKM